MGWLRREADDKTRTERQGLLAELSAGTRVEVLTLDNKLLFVGRIDFMPNGSLKITEEKDRSVPPIEYNSKVKIRGFKKTGSFSLVGQICGSSRTFWCVDRLGAFQLSDKREFFRQNSSIEAWVMCVNRLFDPERETPDEGMQRFPCWIKDISGGGMMVRCKQKYQIGDWIFLTGESPVPNDGTFSFTCRVQRVMAGRSHSDYGCQFVGMTEKEQDRLMRMILLLQRQELQEKRNRD